MKNEDNNSEECKICKAHVFYRTLLDKTDTPEEEAFHSAFEFLMENTIDKVTDEISEENFKLGYELGIADAHEMIGEGLLGIADKMQDTIMSEEFGECTCEED